MFTKRHSTPWKEWEGNGSRERLVLSCKPALVVTVLQKHESHSFPFDEYKHAPCYNCKNRSAPPSDNRGGFGLNGYWKQRWCPNLAYCAPLKQSLFTLVSSGKYHTNTKKREDSELSGSPVRAAGNLPSVVPLCNQATLSFPNYWYSQIFTESRGKNGAYY